MTGTSLRILAAATGLVLASCTHVATSSLNMMPAKEWPLRFHKHSFSARCYDTLECKVYYAGLAHGNERPSPASSTYGPGYLDNWSGGHGMIRNFPPPAEVTWRSKDGQEHRAEIDIGEIFRDEVIRHNVSRQEMADMPDGEYQFEPAVLLEVNDRTIRVYMRALVFLKKRRIIAGVERAESRDDLILMRTHNY